MTTYEKIGWVKPWNGNSTVVSIPTFFLVERDKSLPFKTYSNIVILQIFWILNIEVQNCKTKCNFVGKSKKKNTQTKFKELVLNKNLSIINHKFSLNKFWVIVIVFFEGIKTPYILAA